MTDYVISSRDPRVLDAVRDFLTGNGIDPTIVPRYSTITVEAGRVTTDRYVRDVHGRFALVGGEPVVETVAVDLVVPWPDDFVLHPLCTVEEDGAPCPYVAVGATMRCVQHATPVDRERQADMARLGAKLDADDFAAAHASVQPITRDDIGRAFDVPPRLLGSSAKHVPIPAPARPVATLDDLVDWTQKHGFRMTPWQLDVAKLSFRDHLATWRWSAGARVWRWLRRRRR